MIFLMTQKFPLRPTPVHRETIPSFISRLAAMRKTTTRKFALHMGTSLRKLSQDDDTALAELAYWGGLSDAQFEEMKSWTGMSIGEVKQRFRGEDHGSRTLRSPRVRGCPICLREDHEGKKGTPAENMAMRGHWQLRSVTACIRHSHPLVVLWEAGAVLKRYDYQARINEIAPKILSGAFDQDTCEITEFDLWLDTKLDTGADDTWLDSQPLYASLTFGKLLGAEVEKLRGQTLKTKTPNSSTANNTAFAIMRKGEAAIEAILIELSEATHSGLRDKSATYGKLYHSFNELYCTNPAFSTYQRIFRDVLLKIWDFDDGEIVLGEPLQERILHSVTSAAGKVGTKPQLMEAYLINAGALQHDDKRPFNRKTFDAKEYIHIIEEAASLVTIGDVIKTLHATKAEVEKLILEGHIVPRTSDKKIRKKWSVKEAAEFLASLQKNVIPLQDAQGWERLLQSSNRIKKPLTFLIDLILNGDLKVGRMTEGFNGLVVQKSDVDRFRDDMVDKQTK